MIVITFQWLVPFPIVFAIFISVCLLFQFSSDIYTLHPLSSEWYLPNTLFPLFLFTYFCAIMFSGMSLKRNEQDLPKKYNLVWDTGELSYCGRMPVLLKAFQLVYCFNLLCLLVEIFSVRNTRCLRPTVPRKQRLKFTQ